VGGRAVGLGRCLRFIPFERVHAAREMGERPEVPHKLHLPARQQGREAQGFGTSRGRLRADQGVQAGPDVLEGGAVTIDPRHAGFDQQPALDQLPEQRNLL
jgi:hypothetical protein